MESLDLTRRLISKEKLIKSFRLSVLAGILIIINSGLVGASAKWIPGLLPTLPGSSSNDPAVLLSVSAIGLTCGILVLVGALLMRLKPNRTKLLGVWIAVFSLPSVISGGGFIAGFILGLFGGKTAFSAKTISKT